MKLKTRSEALQGAADYDRKHRWEAFYLLLVKVNKAEAKLDRAQAELNNLWAEWYKAQDELDRARGEGG